MKAWCLDCICTRALERVLSFRSMKRTTASFSSSILALFFLSATHAEAQGFAPVDEGPTVQIAPFVGYQFGGSMVSQELDEKYSFKSGLDYGGTMDITLNPTWRVELLYSRQDTRLQSTGVAGPSFDLAVERYMVGIEEEKGKGSVKFYGVLLLGATRFIPGFEDAGSEINFTGGIALGVKSFVSSNFGIRLEARGFYTAVTSGGDVFCSAGRCLFSFSGSGIWQGDVNAGLILAF
jgi:hypothetical protein